MINSRAAGAALCAALVLLALSGCSPAARVAATLRDGTVVFVDCEDAPGIDTISVHVEPRSGRVGGYVWQVSGEGDLGPESPITYGVTPAGFAVQTEPKSLDLHGTRVSFALTGYAGGVSYSDVLVVRGDDLRESLWLDNRGNLDEEPCR